MSHCEWPCGLPGMLTGSRIPWYGRLTSPFCAGAAVPVQLWLSVCAPLEQARWSLPCLWAGCGETRTDAATMRSQLESAWLWCWVQNSGSLFSCTMKWKWQHQNFSAWFWGQAEILGTQSPHQSPILTKQTLSPGLNVHLVLFSVKNYFLYICRKNKKAKKHTGTRCILNYHY